MRTMEKVARGALTKRVMPDRSKIAVTSDNEVKYWTKHFGVTARIWNAPSIEFYKSLGAVMLDEWTVCKVGGPALAALARTASCKTAS